MNQLTKKQIQSLFQNTRFDEPLFSHCTFHIGGPADAFLEVKNLDKENLLSLESLLKFLKKAKIQYFILGGGSNVLFNDKGFRGVVIKISANQINFKKNRVEAEAGAILQLLVAKAKERGFYNLVQLTGIPGSIGGAIRGNAGANGIETKDVLISATILDTKTGEIKTTKTKDLKFSYRNSSIKKKKNSIVLKAIFRLSKDNEKKSLVDEINGRRKLSQPWGFSAGSYFKNPKNQKAGFLIEQCGLKGKKLGGAIISDKHANFIQNANNPKKPATQKDVLALATLAKKEVLKNSKFGLRKKFKSSQPT
jgi:UDP-N-acetylmuramate dehydrogenase